MFRNIKKLEYFIINDNRKFLISWGQVLTMHNQNKKHPFTPRSKLFGMVYILWYTKLKQNENKGIKWLIKKLNNKKRMEFF